MWSAMDAATRRRASRSGLRQAEAVGGVEEVGVVVAVAVKVEDRGRGSSEGTRGLVVASAEDELRLAPGPTARPRPAARLVR
jgi:hypothetical protein